ncbi:MAG TPA: hypothetical protein VGW77_16215 [Candidatus Binatia bacterium]|jgi:hypothetical protein|nr:hypothetical protein [Candidatus Binatia bacterium]
MTRKHRLYFAIIICFGFIGELILLGYRARMSLAAETETKTSVTALGPPRRSLNLVSLVPVTTIGGTATVAVYDDPATPRKEDYLELYGGSGELVAVGWFDEFGIQRLAVDRAVVEGRDELQGVFVMVVEGDGI